MKGIYRLGLVLLIVSSIAVTVTAQDQGLAVEGAVGTAFTYQGRLSDGGGPASGDYDLQFNLYGSSAGGSSLGQVKVNDVPVSEGLFAVLLDFGASAFDGGERWLEIAVRPGSGGSYTTVSPRQLLSPAPYAIYASTAPWSGLEGTPPGLSDGDDDTLGGLSCAPDQVAQWNGSAWVCAGGGSAWSLTGNAGTNPGTHYLGTSDNKALEIKVKGDGALRLEPGGDSPNLAGGYKGNVVKAGTAGGAIGGGGNKDWPQKVTDNYGAVGGGAYNQAGDGDGNVGNATFATVGGGWHNQASGVSSTVGGGHENQASGDYAAVTGGIGNDAAAYAATVGGGLGNTASAPFATVGGGGRSDVSKPETANQATDRWTTVGGGARNLAGNGNGDANDAEYATVGGGYLNKANGRQSTVAGGADNEASYRATVGGGLTNKATGSYGVVPGGYLNAASGDYSFAAGQRAKANHIGAFVWADSTAADFGSRKADEFAVRASGGVRLKTDDFQIFDSAGHEVFSIDENGVKNLGLDMKSYTIDVRETSRYLTLGDFNLCVLSRYFIDALGDLDHDVGLAECRVYRYEGIWRLSGTTDERVVCDAICF